MICKQLSQQTMIEDGLILRWKIEIRNISGLAYHIWNPNIPEAEAGRLLCIWGQPRGEILSNKAEKKNYQKLLCVLKTKE